MISEEMIMSLSRKVLTIYTDRGWVESNPKYCEKSVVRGYAGLNAHVHKLIRNNPKLTVHSVSHSSILYPDDGTDSGLIGVFISIVYSGEIKNLNGFMIPERFADSFDDDGSGHGTIIKVSI